MFVNFTTTISVVCIYIHFCKKGSVGFTILSKVKSPWCTVFVYTTIEDKLTVCAAHRLKRNRVP